MHVTYYFARKFSDINRVVRITGHFAARLCGDKLCDAFLSATFVLSHPSLERMRIKMAMIIKHLSHSVSKCSERMSIERIASNSSYKWS